MRKLSGYGPSLMVLATAALVLVAGPSIVRQLTFVRSNARIFGAGERLESSTIFAQLNQSYRDIAAFVSPSVVHISAERAVPSQFASPRRSVSSGSGWVYDADGHVVTNYHVVEGATRIEVQLDTGDLRPAQLVGFDEFTDIAVIRIDPQRLHPATRSDDHEIVQQGDLVFAFGSPFDFRFSMSSGVVSGKDRSVGVIRNRAGQRVGYENFIQVDAAINPGNSGGPLTDYLGHVIGMNTAIATGRSNGTDEGQFAGIGLAIPLAMIEPVVEQLIEKGFVDKGYLGIQLVELTRDVRQEYTTLGFAGDGVVVRDLIAEAPAIEAGLKPRDVITHVNDEHITSDDQLRSLISSILPGRTVVLTVWRYDFDARQARTLKIPVTLARLDVLRATGIVPLDHRNAIPSLGIAKMGTSSPDLAHDYGAEHVEGVLLEEVVPGSRLDRQVDPGAIVVSVMEYRVRSVEEFLDRLRQFDPRRGVQIEVIHPDGRRDRSVMLGID